jgi:glutaredoxin 3
MPEITLYSTDHCPYCERAKELLLARGLDYQEIKLEITDREALGARTGMMTFPQILIGEHVVGGWDQLLAATRSGELDALLAR